MENASKCSISFGKDMGYSENYGPILVTYYITAPNI